MFTAIQIHLLDENVFEVRLPQVIDAGEEARRYLREGVAFAPEPGVEVFYPAHSIRKIVVVQMSALFGAVALIGAPKEED